MNKYAITALLVLTLLAISACSSGNNVSYEEQCLKDGSKWMTMMPTVDGVPTGEPKCSGCMIDKTHYCSQEDYLAAKAG